MNTYVCAHEECVALICFTPEQDRKVKTTHEMFRCPFGHQQNFPQKTDEEEEIEQLRRRISARDRRIRHQDNEVDRLERKVRSLRARLGAKTRKLRAVA